jgi:hypothetical protein
MALTGLVGVTNTNTKQIQIQYILIHISDFKVVIFEKEKKNNFLNGGLLIFDK